MATLKYLFLLFIVQIYTKRLVFVQSLFRHGARFPISLNGLNSNGKIFIKNNLGQLTSQGKQMHYLLGKAMFKKYWEPLFGDIQIQEQQLHKLLYVRSTNVNRTIQSAQAQIQGLFQSLKINTSFQKDYSYSQPPFQNISSLLNTSFKQTNQGQRQRQHSLIKNSENFHAFPIYIDTTEEKGRGDFLLKYSTKNCPKQSQWMKQNKQGQMVKYVRNLPQIKLILKKLSEVFPNQTITFGNAPAYIDNNYCMQHLTGGKSIREFFKQPQYANSLNYLRSVTLYLYHFYQEIQLRSISSDIFEQTVINIQGSKSKAGPKLILYSAHDNTVAMMLASLNLTSVKCINEKFLQNISNQQTCISQFPEFASSLIIQIYEQKAEQNNLKSSKYSIELLYNNKRRRIPFCNWQYSCPLQQFYKWVQVWNVQRSENACNVNMDWQNQLQSDDQKNTILTVLIIIIQLLIILVLIFCLVKRIYKQKCNQCQKNSHGIFNQENDIQNQEDKEQKVQNQSIITKFYQYFK